MGELGGVKGDGHGGSEIRMNRYGLELKGMADEGLVGFLDVGAV